MFPWSGTSPSESRSGRLAQVFFSATRGVGINADLALGNDAVLGCWGINFRIRVFRWWMMMPLKFLVCGMPTSGRPSEDWITGTGGAARITRRALVNRQLLENLRLGADLMLGIIHFDYGAGTMPTRFALGRSTDAKRPIPRALIREVHSRSRRNSRVGTLVIHASTVFTRLLGGEGVFGDGRILPLTLHAGCQHRP